jgi:multidrug efflux pump subunit AcrA (membrane-fusion protein)
MARVALVCLKEFCLNFHPTFIGKERRMIRSGPWQFCVSAALAVATSGGSQVSAQGNLPMASTGDNVVIKKEAVRVIDPHKYRVPLSIEAIQTVTLIAPFDGTIRQILMKTNAKGQPQGEVVRMDNTIQKLHLAQAQAALKIAMIELKAAGKEEIPAALAQAKIDLKKIEVEIVQSQLDQTSIRMPFAGEVQRLLVTDGQFVRAGDAIAIVADSSKMKVEIPVDRASADNGKAITVKIESNEVEGKIDAVLPLPAKFDVLRELFDSITSVQVVVENGDGKLKVGQTVYVPLIPRQPVVEVPISAVGNLADGHRKVQVVRQLIVRDISVALMGQVGSSRVFVSGPFAEGDEVIYDSSHQLGDAFQLRHSAAASPAATAGAGQPGVPATGAATKPPAVGF